jgi:hypothetical protein|uniref:Uncharacterized protein n=1 Tax=Populus trichocarpa TaxID=3694 RepID=A0A3N7G6N1_POPTR
MGVAMEASILQLAIPLAGSPVGGTSSTSLADVSRSQECRTVLEEELREMVRGKNDDLKHDLDQLSISRYT